MVRNEEKSLPKTLGSLEGHFVNSVIAYDTGSSDTTISLLQSFCEREEIPLHLLEGDFVDFAVSRNVLLNFADTVENVDYYLLLDSNDEVKNKEGLRTFIQKETMDKKTYYLPLVLENDGVRTRSKSIRLIKARCDWRYMGSVHEYISNYGKVEDAGDIHAETYIYQEIVEDEESKEIEKEREKEIHIQNRSLLSGEYIRTRSPRALFYLAKTCYLLGDMKQAYLYFEIRVGIDGEDSLDEERYESMMSCGNIATDWKTKRQWYMDAWEFAHRVEPLVEIANHYQLVKDAVSMYMFSKTACSLPFPSSSRLSIQENCYNYERWHLLAACACHVGDFPTGKNAAEIAVKARNLNIDKELLAAYTSRES